jgi:cation diffusion facilitator family transporter
VSGIGIRLAVILVESIALWQWGYAALLTDLVASLLDIVSSFAILFAIRLAARPPDEEHPFGHGRIEPLAGLQMGVLIALSGGWLAIRHMLGLVQTEAAGWVSGYAWMVPFGASIAMEIAARLVHSVGTREQSTALLAEAGHYRIDAVTSLVAAVGLAAASTWPELGHRLDLVSAALLASIMVVLGGLAVRENLHQLLDRVPLEVHFEQVKSSALKVEGVLDVEKVRIQHAGPDAHVDIDIEVAPDLTVAAAHVITQHVRVQIQEDWPFVREVVVHVEPFYADDH